MSTIVSMSERSLSPKAIKRADFFVNLEASSELAVPLYAPDSGRSSHASGGFVPGDHEERHRIHECSHNSCDCVSAPCARSD